MFENGNECLINVVLLGPFPVVILPYLHVRSIAKGEAAPDGSFDLDDPVSSKRILRFPMSNVFDDGGLRCTASLQPLSVKTHSPKVVPPDSVLGDIGDGIVNFAVAANCLPRYLRSRKSKPTYAMRLMAIDCQDRHRNKS